MRTKFQHCVSSHAKPSQMFEAQLLKRLSEMTGSEKEINVNL